jgi:DNA-binding MarR family transcriptional regulator
MMKHFTMNIPKLETDSSQSPAARFLPDERGCLYDPNVRSMFTEGQSDIASIEGLAAMRLAFKGMHGLMERWAEKHGLSEGRLGLMFRLRRQGEVALSDLADALSVSPRNVTGLVDHLERDGLVERVADPTDRRSVRARLTPAGSDRIDSIWREALAHQTHITDGFSKEDLEQLRHLCLRMVENMTKKETGK